LLCHTRKFLLLISGNNSDGGKTTIPRAGVGATPCQKRFLGEGLVTTVSRVFLDREAKPSALEKNWWLLQMFSIVVLHSL
jgi:hypothetical protein